MHLDGVFFIWQLFRDIYGIFNQIAKENTEIPAFQFQLPGRENFSSRGTCFCMASFTLESPVISYQFRPAS